MSPNATTSQPLLSGDASELLDQFAVCEAAELARAGAYSGAEALLRDLVNRADAPNAAMDLQARVCAQQGRMGEAARWWQKVLDQDPTNAPAQAALARLNKLQTRPVWLQTIWPVCVAAAVILCGALAIGWEVRCQKAATAQLERQWAETIKTDRQMSDQQMQVLITKVQLIDSNQTALLKTRESTVQGMAKLASIDGRLSSLASAQEAVSQQLRDNQETQMRAISNQMLTIQKAMERGLADTSDLALADATRLENRIATLAGDHANVFTRPASPQSAPRVSITVTGVRVQSSDDSVRLIFEEGLFDHGTHFKLGAKERLAAVLKNLAQSKEQFTIEVVGYSDDDQGFFGPLDGYSVGLKRASAVLDLIRNSTLFAPSQLQASTSGSTRLPFPSDTESNRARNRTVALRVKPTNLH